MQHVVIALIQQDNGHVLTLQRAKGEVDGVVWGFPGGKVDPGETEEQAVVRETFEETGVACAAVEKIGARAYPELTLHYWRCRMTGGAPRDPDSGEVRHVAFRTPDDVLRLIPAAKIYPLVRQALGLPAEKPAAPPLRP